MTSEPANAAMTVKRADYESDDDTTRAKRVKVENGGVKTEPTTNP